MSEPRVYKLTKPLEDGGKVITEVPIRELTVGDLRDLEIKLAGDGAMTLSVGALLDCAGSVLGWDPALVNKLGLEDAMGIAALVAEGFPGLAP